MTGRSGSVTELRSDGRGTGWAFLVALIAFAMVATAVLVLTTEPRWLRLGIVAALWAALFGAFAAARYRYQAVEGRKRVTEMHRIYELELERECAARQEYELEIEAETRRRIEAEVHSDLEALREELRVLRENLQALLGGEVLVERVALRAESTRMRSLSDQARVLASGGDRVIAAGDAGRRLPVGAGKNAQTAPAAKPDESTQLVDRPARQEPAARKDPRRVEPARPEPSRPDPARSAPGRAEPRQQPAAARREPVLVEATKPVSEPATTTDRIATQLDHRRNESPKTEVFNAGRPPQPAQGQPHQGQPHSGMPRVGVPVRNEPPRTTPEPPRPQPPRDRQPQEPPTERTEFPKRQPQPEPSFEQRAGANSSGAEEGAGRRRRDDDPMPPLATKHIPVSANTETTGRRRKTEPKPFDRIADSLLSRDRGELAGRRHRPDESASGSHRRKPERDGENRGAEPAPEPAHGSDFQRQSAEEHRAADSDPSGSHAAGRSVNELLAAYGGVDTAPRRRRRAD